MAKKQIRKGSKKQRWSLPSSDDISYKREKQESKGGGSGEFRTLKNKERFRIMPPVDGNPWYFTFFRHFQAGIANNICPALTFDDDSYKRISSGDCAICDESNSLFDGDDSDQKKGRSIYGKQRHLINAIVTTDEEPKVEVIEIPKTVLENIYRILDNEEIGTQLFDPEDGFDIKMIVAKQDEYNKYELEVARKSSPIEIENWEDESGNLEDALAEYMLEADEFNEQYTGGGKKKSERKKEKEKDLYGDEFEDDGVKDDEGGEFEDDGVKDDEFEDDGVKDDEFEDDEPSVRKRRIGAKAKTGKRN